MTSPRKMHPNQLYQMSVTILELYYEFINVRASIRMGFEEIAQTYQTFYTTGTQMMVMKVS